jgi:glycosyltransferase involved in cell wall biosynthesis
LLICQKQDIILVVTNPPLLPFVALLIKWFKGCRLVLLIHDVYPEVLIATGLAKPSSAIVKIGQIMNRVLYNQSDKIITLGRDMSKLAKAKLSSNKNDEQICCITNWADNDLIRPILKANNTLLQKLKINDRFVILYAGNIGRTHGIEYLAEAAKILKKNTNIHFIVLGFGAKKKWLEEYVKNEKLESVSILPPCPRSELMMSLNACDVALISFVPGMAGISVPSRMYNQMAAGKPIIAVADDWSELAEVVREEEIGWVIPPGNVEELVHTIELAAANPELCAQMGAKAAAVARSKYDFTQTDKAYKKLFGELC